MKGCETGFLAIAASGIVLIKDSFPGFQTFRELFDRFARKVEKRTRPDIIGNLN